MDTVISPELAYVLHQNGSIPIFHRWLKFEQEKELFNRYPSAFFSVGLSDKERVFQLINGLGVKNLIIDVAHGHDIRVLKLMERLLDEDDSLNIIAGNVCTSEGYTDLANAGASAVKVGIGPGAACTTRTVTGFGVPQFSALQSIGETAKRLKIPFIADGGIRTSSDVIKSLAVGAASVMIGRAFADTAESAAVGVYRGQASEQFQVERMRGVKKGTVPEGVAIEVFQDRPAQELIDMLLGGIRSGMTYGGARNLEELQAKAEFVEVTRNYIDESNARP
jgi:IMP dehydrogenase